MFSRQRRLRLRVLAMLLLVSLQPLAACDSPGDADRAGQLDGYWASDGYGMLFKIRGGTLRISQTTKISCAKVAVARKVPSRSSAAKTTFQVDDDRSLPVLDVDSGLLTISKATALGTRRLHVDGAVSDIGLRRVDAAPHTCARPPANSPRHNFDIFWETFREQYPFFALHGMDWEAVRDRFRPRVTDETTSAQLHAIFAQMIKPLRDAHTYVELDAKDLEFDGERTDPQPLTDDEFDRIDEIVDRRLIGKRRYFADGEVSFGRLPNRVGYLNIAGFSDYSDSGRTSDELAELDRALDVALSKPMSRLVIDVRNNGGGSDVLGNAIASRLTRAPYTAYAKTARNDPDDPHQFTRPQTVKITPSTDTTFTGPVKLLTSRYSVSAAETFAQAMLGRPNVVRIGENTQGVFSDVLNRALPDGIVFGLPNEVYTTNGKAYDKVGIAPGIRTGPVFRRSDLKAGRDPELDAALR